MVTGRGSFSGHRPSAARSCSGERATTPSLKPRLRLVRFIGPSTAGTRGRRTRISTRGSSESTKSSTRGSRSCARPRSVWGSSRRWTDARERAMTGAGQSAAGGHDDRSGYLVAGFVLLLVVLCGLVYYKWGGAIRTVSGVRELGRWSGTADGLTTGGVLRVTLFYFRRIWIALAYGLLIGAAVRAFVPPRRVAGLLSWGGPVRRQVAAGLAGAPPMLCSCCIPPIFQSGYERGARVGLALPAMVAFPGVNPAALLLTAILFPPSLAVARIAAVLVAVFGLAPLIERTVGAGLVVADGRFAPLTADDVPGSLKETVARFAGALGYLTVRTVPLVLGGVRSEEHTSELQSRLHLVCRLLLEKKKKKKKQ